VRLFDADATRERLPLPALIEALREMFISGCEVPARHVHPVGDGTVLLMPAWRVGAFLGVKTVNVFPANGARGLPGVHAVYTLFDARTGEPLAQMDGNEITARRTVGASALAASFLARQDARRLLVVGAGRVARLVAEAMRAVRPGLDQVELWSRRPEAAQALAAAVGGQAVADLEAAVRRADIVSCATLAGAPLVHGAWLADGVHLDLVGSFTPAMREADGAAFARARVFVDTAEALTKSGDLVQAVAEGAFDTATVQGTLAELCRGERAGRAVEDEITLFKSVGSALEDLAAAELAWGAPR
jgi:ornithine cyclodeaminase/alanine dehydrogenase-like protein (mu-crystallin family)